MRAALAFSGAADDADALLLLSSPAPCTQSSPGPGSPRPALSESQALEALQQAIRWEELCRDGDLALTEIESVSRASVLALQNDMRGASRRQCIDLVNREVVRNEAYMRSVDDIERTIVGTAVSDLCVFAKKTVVTALATGDVASAEYTRDVLRVSADAFVVLVRTM